MTTKKASMSGLLATKGAATAVEDEVPAKRVQVHVPAPKQMESAPVVGATKNLSVKLDSERYRELRLMAVDTGRSHQELMVEAFDMLLRSRKEHA
jgi:hypothetical protein